MWGQHTEELAKLRQEHDDLRIKFTMLCQHLRVCLINNPEADFPSLPPKFLLKLLDHKGGPERA